MINIYEMRRKHTKWSIEQNPIEITIKRTEKKRADGYFEEKESMVGPFIVRIFIAKSSSPHKIQNLAGEKQVDRYFGMLADHEADIQANTHVTDKFEANGIKYEVKAVYPQRINNKVTGYQCELERVE